MSSTNEGSKSGGTVKLKRHVGVVGLLFAAIGSIIGSGWLFGAFNASAIAGPAALFSWLIAGVMILLIALTYAELGPMFPISGGVVRYPHLVWGSFTSYSLGFITWISTVAVPAIEVEGALTYATKFAGFTSAKTVNGDTVHVLTPLGFVVAALLLALFVVVNYFGVRLFTQINNVLVWWKLGVILLVIVVFLFTALSTTRMGSPSNFTSHGFAPGGFQGIFVAISTAGITFSFLGFRQGIELAGESKNPSRNIPIAVIGSVLITSVIYALLQVAFTLGVPAALLGKSGGWEKLTFTNDFGPLAAISTIAGLGWLAALLYLDAIISPADTGLVYTTIASRVSYALGKNGNAPAWLSTNNKFGVPYWGLVVTFVAGLFLLLPFPSWQQLVGFITSATVISFGVGPLVLGALRREMPERERPFRLPGGDAIPLLAFYAANMIIYWGGWSTNSKLFVTILIGYVLLVVFQLSGRRKANRPLLEFKAGAVWVLPWFAAMALISYFFDPATHPSLFNWVFLINIVVTVAVYYLAMRMRLPRDRVDEHIRDAENESLEEEEETAVGA
ncbi:amino acid permease [Frondihabitans sucicola]|uniref:Amino acid permease n=1 Tax=Frondihabitans sucicola TaxID=1268041 RepID=A0ABN6XTZ7_9MICO|nr:APC family permease [Frondihabitans sucicola]BDZ48276.1 amino acid permease [Frondihabitans sucicola]